MVTDGEKIEGIPRSHGHAVARLDQLSPGKAIGGVGRDSRTHRVGVCGVAGVEVQVAPVQLGPLSRRVRGVTAI